MSNEIIAQREDFEILGRLKPGELVRYFEEESPYNILKDIMEARIPKPGDDPSGYRTRLVVEGFISAFHNLIKYSEYEYAYHLELKKGYPWADWLKANPKHPERLNRVIAGRVKKSRFYDGLDYLWNRKNYRSSLETAKILNIPHRKKKGNYYHPILETINYQHMSNSLSQRSPISVLSCRKLVKAYIRFSCLALVGRKGRQRSHVFKLGDWIEYGGRSPNVVPLIKKDTHERLLQKWEIEPQNDEL